jgi:hypothetical protein
MRDFNRLQDRNTCFQFNFSFEAIEKFVLVRFPRGKHTSPLAGLPELPQAMAPGEMQDLTILEEVEQNEEGNP